MGGPDAGHHDYRGGRRQLYRFDAVALSGWRGGDPNFPVRFSVPQGRKLRELSFSLKNNQTFDRPNDVRVSLNDEKSHTEKQ